MTEENQDQTPPKLRLSPESRQAKAEKPAETDLELKRSDNQVKKSASPDNASAQMAGPSDKAVAEHPFDPENPFAGIDIKKPKEKRQAPELPSKPAPVEKDGSARKVEEAIERIGDDDKNHSILTSMVVIVILLALLGGSGYGLYYLLRSPAESAEATVASEEMEPEATGNETAGESDSPQKSPIAKAKAAVTKKENSGSLSEESISPTVSDKAHEPQAGDIEKSGPAKASRTAPVSEIKAATPPINSSQTNAISEFLRGAHIGGVRTGDHPKLILNGQSYNQGDLVDADTGLRFIGFRNKKLAFRDAQGVVYIKSF